MAQPHARRSRGHTPVLASIALFAIACSDSIAPRAPSARDPQRSIPQPLAAQLPVTGYPFASVVTGGSHTCALATGGQAFCWGSGFFDQLGVGFPNSRSSNPLPVAGGLTFIALDLGLNHSCGLTKAGKVYCWGINSLGELGDGTKDRRNAPTPVLNAPTFVALAVGLSHACGLTKVGAAYCWGHNGSGQLGDGSSDERPGAVAVTGNHKFAALSAGGNVTCGLKTDGKALCWGSNRFGQLANEGDLGDYPVPGPIAGSYVFTAVAVGGAHTCALTKGGQALCWGQNLWGQLGTGSTAEIVLTQTVVSSALTFVSISAGSQNTCAISKSGKTLCWGRNDNGELGNGGTEQSAVPVEVAGQFPFSRVSVGHGFSCGTTKSLGTWCWGTNTSGQLGVDESVSGEFSMAPMPVSAPFFPTLP